MLSGLERLSHNSFPNLQNSAAVACGEGKAAFQMKAGIFLLYIECCYMTVGFGGDMVQNICGKNVDVFLAHHTIIQLGYGSAQPFFFLQRVE